MVRLHKYYEQNKRTLILALAATFLWGLLAHGYCFFHYNFSHDSLLELHGAIFGNDWKISLGRVFVPLYRDLVRSDVTLPWLIGVLSLFWIGLAVFLTACVLEIRSGLLIFLTAGIFTTNITVSATAATYLHDLDCYMFSLLCAVMAVWLWRFCRWGLAGGSLCLAISMGMYQGFLSTAVTLVMFVCILWLLEGEHFRKVLAEGLKAIGMILLGGLLYFLAVKVIQSLMQVQMLSGNYNSLDQVTQLTPRIFLSLVGETYRDWFFRLTNAPSAYPAVLVKGSIGLLALVSAVTLMGDLGSRRIGRVEKLLCFILLALLPLGMNLIYVLTQGEVHDLMVFSIWLTSLFALLLCRRLMERFAQQEWLAKRKIHCWLGVAVTSVLILLLYGNVQFSNGMYLKKDLEQEAALSYMTRVMVRVEEQEGYCPGQTQVFFAGVPKNIYSYPAGFREYSLITGMESAELLQVGTRQRYQMLFDYLLGVPVCLVEEEQWNILQNEPSIAQMPCYPETGSIQSLGEILVVKLGG